MRRASRLRLGVTAAMLVAGSAAAAAVIATAGAGDTTAARRGAHFLGPLPPEARIEFAVALRLPHRAALLRYVKRLPTAPAPSFRRFLTPTELGKRFGLSDRRVDRVTRFLIAAGIDVREVYDERTAVRAQATAAAIRRTFGVSIGRFRSADGRTYHAPLGPVRVPDAIAREVLSVRGLSSRPVAAPADVPVGGLKPIDAARVYDVTPLWDRGIRGDGETVALVSFDTYESSDVALFDRLARIRGAPPVEKVPVRGGVAKPGGGEVEVDLDIDVVRSLAPGANILNFEAPAWASFADVIHAIVADRRAQIVSISWGKCDDPRNFVAADQSLDEAAAARKAEADEFAMARAAGLAIFAAAGDAGGYDCEESFFGDYRPTVDWPAASPDVIAVGGTHLSLARDGGYSSEAGWENVLSRLGGGGGLSAVDARPAWQRGPGVTNRFSTGKRQLPDVAGPADLDSGFFIVVDGNSSLGNGTSQAAPFWAGVTALVHQYLRRQAGGAAVSLRDYAAALYRLGREKQPYPPFHDVRTGGNRLYDAGPGWDYATGLGTPDVFALARDLARTLGRAKPR